MEDKIQITLAERANKYISKNEHVVPDRQGDAALAFCHGAISQMDIDKATYLPYIDYLQQALVECARLLREQSVKPNSVQLAILADGWENGAAEQKAKVPYGMMMFPDGQVV